MTTQEIIDGLLHTADDHPCCKVFLLAVVDCLREQEAEIATLRADKERLVSLLEQLVFAQENADETGYVADYGFIDIEKLHAEARAAIDAARAGEAAGKDGAK